MDESQWRKFKQTDLWKALRRHIDPLYVAMARESYWMGKLGLQDNDELDGYLAEHHRFTAEGMPDEVDLADLLRDDWHKRESARESLVTLSEAAAMVNRRKRSLESHKSKLPAPRVKGGPGQPDLWAWSEIRPELEKIFGRVLPSTFPRAT